VDPIATFVLVVAVALLVLGVLSYNRFVTQRASVAATWSGIEVELQRRHDVVPALVDTVRGYAAHERAVLDEVTAARAEAIAAVPQDVDTARQARAEDRLTDQLTRLFAVTEAFPELRADRSFRDLQRQLVETEDRIAASRRLYNLEVAAYERRRGAVPSNLIASWFGFGPAALFEIRDPAAQHTPHVDLDRSPDP
jgi:LemA protein